MGCQFHRETTVNYSPEDESCPGKSVEFDEDVLQILVKRNLIVTVEKLAEKFGFGHSIIHRYLRTIGKVSKLHQWVSHI